MAQHPHRLRRTLAAIAQGLRDTRANPKRAAQVIAKAGETRDVALIRARLAAVTPVFAPGLVGG